MKKEERVRERKIKKKRREREKAREEREKAKEEKEGKREKVKRRETKTEEIEIKEKEWLRERDMHTHIQKKELTERQEKERDTRREKVVGWLVVLHGTSILICYLMPNPVHTYILDI